MKRLVALTVLLVAPAAQAHPPFAKLVQVEPVRPDCKQQRETGVRLQTRKACRAAAEWGEWMVESGEGYGYERPVCDRLSKTRVRCDVTVDIDGILPSGKLVNRHRFTTISRANRGCVDLRVWRMYSTRCWL